MVLRPMRAFPTGCTTSYRVNTLCRLGWALYISKDDKVVAQHVTLVLGAVELYRRAQWALLRIEGEQIRRAAEEAHEKLAREPSIHDNLESALLCRPGLGATEGNKSGSSSPNASRVTVNA